MNNNTALTVPFHGNQLFVINHENEPFTPMKPIVEGMGLAWSVQHRKLTENKCRWGITEMVIPSAGGLQDMLCLPLRKLFGWLMTIHPNKVKPEIREAVIRYQNECDDVLWNHWKKQHELPFNPHKDIQDEVWRVSGGKQSLKAELYRMVKDRFGVERFTDIPAHQCQAAVEYVRSLKPEVTVPALNLSADPDTVKRAFAIAAEVSAVASRTVFDAVLTGDNDWLHRRWLFALSQNPQGQPQPYAAVLDSGAFLTTFAHLPDMILAGDGLLPSNKELAQLASACSQKLSQRLANGVGLPPPRN